MNLEVCARGGCACECVCESECVCLCVCVCQRERERNMCVYVCSECAHVRECACMCAFKTTLREYLRAGLPLGFPSTAPPPVLVSAVLGTLAVWTPNQKRKEKVPELIPPRNVFPGSPQAGLTPKLVD